MNRKTVLMNVIIGISLAGLLSSSASASETNISLYLKWVPQYQFAGYLVAKANGYYKKLGLNVKIISGGPDINTVQEVADGAAQFGIQTPEPIFYAYEHGLKLKMLMADFQKPYEEFMVRKTSNIKSIADFKGKTIGINIGGLSQLLLPYMLEKNGVNPNQVRTVRKTLSLAPFLSGRIPIWNGYVGNEPFESMDQGVPVREFKLAKYAPNWYGDTLFSTSKYIKEHQDVVKNFVKASQKGWDFSINHPQKTIDIILNDNAQKTRKQLEQEASAVIPLFTSET
ncbi:ABC transporter substrate-binding protein, partial [Acidithiobacillus ferridurans]|nr:ABC transporter substrate-binding protein [Acidithiobacillus ferridurans]